MSAAPTPDPIVEFARRLSETWHKRNSERFEEIAGNSRYNVEDMLSGLANGLERAVSYARATTFEGAIVQLALAWNAVDEMHNEEIRNPKAEPKRDGHPCNEFHRLKALISSALVVAETHVGKTAEQLGMSLYICRPRRSDLPDPQPAG
jgi:hypothetical protein